MADDSGEIESNNAIIALQQSALIEAQKKVQNQEKEANERSGSFWQSKSKLAEDKAFLLDKKKSNFEKQRSFFKDHEEKPEEEREKFREGFEKHFGDEEDLFRKRKKRFDDEKKHFEKRKEHEKLEKDLQEKRFEVDEEEWKRNIEKYKGLSEEYENGDLVNRMIKKSQSDVNKKIYGSLGDKDGKIFGGESFAANMELFRKDSKAYVDMVSQRFKDKMLSPFRGAANKVRNVFSGIKFGAQFIGSLFRNTKKSGKAGAMKLAGIQEEEEKKRQEELDKEAKSNAAIPFKEVARKKPSKGGEQPDKASESLASESSGFGSEAAKKLGMVEGSSEAPSIEAESGSSEYYNTVTSHLEKIDSTTTEILSVVKEFQSQAIAYIGGISNVLGASPLSPESPDLGEIIDLVDVVSGGLGSGEDMSVSPEMAISPVGAALALPGPVSPEMETPPVAGAMLALPGPSNTIGVEKEKFEPPAIVDTSISSADTSITSDADAVDEALDQEEHQNTVEDYLKQIASNTGAEGEDPTIQVENIQGEGGGLMDMLGGVLGDFFGDVGGSLIKKFAGPLLGKVGSLAKMMFSGPGLAIAGIAIGATMMVKDAFDGVKKAKEWGTSKTSAGAAGAIAGTGPGIGEGAPAGEVAKGIGKNALKWGAMGAGIGFFIGGPLGSAVGGAIGAGLGAITAAIGPKRIAKAFDKIGTGLKVYGKGIINGYKMAGKTVWNGLKMIGNTYKAVGKAGFAMAKGYVKTGWALAKGVGKTAGNVFSTAKKGIGWFGKSVGNIVGGAFDGFKKGGLKGLFSGAKEGVKKSIDEGKTIITDAVKAQKDIVKETAGEVKSIAKETMGEVKNVASEYVKDQKEIVKDTIDYGKELVKDTLSPLEEEKKKAKEGAEKVSETVVDSVPNDGSLEKSGKVIKGAMVGFSDIGERNLEAQEANISELSSVAKVKEKETNKVTGENTNVIAENNDLLKDAKKEKEFKQLSKEQIDAINQKNKEYSEKNKPKEQKAGNNSKDVDLSLVKDDPAKLRKLMESNNVQLFDSDAAFEDAKTKRTVLKNSIISQNLSGQISEEEAELALKAIKEASDDAILKLNDGKEELPPTSQKQQNQDQQSQNKVDRVDREAERILQEHEAKKPETIVVTTQTYVQQNKTDYFGRQPYAVPGM